PSIGRVGVPGIDALAGDPMPRPEDPAELLDVDVDQLPWAFALVALCGLEAQASEPAHPDAGEDARNRRECHPQRLGDLWAGEAQSPERRDRLDSLFLGSMGDRERGR